MKRILVIFIFLFTLGAVFSQGPGGNSNKSSDDSKEEQGGDMKKPDNADLRDKRNSENIPSDKTDKKNKENEINYERINSCIAVSDEISKKLTGINKEIKMKEKKSKDFAESYKYIADKNNELEKIKKEFFDNLNREGKNLVKDQMVQINTIEKEIREQIKAIEKNIKDNAGEKELFASTKKLEDSINKVNRQYQAILWLLENEK